MSVNVAHSTPCCKLFGLDSEPSLARLALIVRGADTARPDIAPEAAGLHAVSLGLSALWPATTTMGCCGRGVMVYDALFGWLRFAAEERHNWPAKGGVTAMDALTETAAPAELCAKLSRCG